MPLSVGVQFAIFSGVAVAKLDPDVVSGFVQLVVCYGLQAAACVPRAIGSEWWLDSGRRDARRSGERGALVEWDGVQIVACAQRAAGWSCQSDGGQRCRGRRTGRAGRGGAACRVRRRAGCRVRGACTLCFVSA